VALQAARPAGLGLAHHARPWRAAQAACPTPRVLAWRRRVSSWAARARCAIRAWGAELLVTPPRMDAVVLARRAQQQGRALYHYARLPTPHALSRWAPRGWSSMRMSLCVALSQVADLLMVACCPHLAPAGPGGCGRVPAHQRALHLGRGRCHQPRAGESCLAVLGCGLRLDAHLTVIRYSIDKAHL
jgi:hypothetical protein